MLVTFQGDNLSTNCCRSPMILKNVVGSFDYFIIFFYAIMETGILIFRIRYISGFFLPIPLCIYLHVSVAQFSNFLVC